ncbi:MAG: T9SS type A sorting domain-containing protein [bacterium]|nr:T9SS type A sorting domain-containing protein [bacterium]
MKKSLGAIFLLILIIFSGYTQQWSTPEKLPEPINVNAWSIFPFITYDGKRLYFASDRINHSTEDIYYCDWDGHQWGEAIRLNSNINTAQRELSPSLTANGKTLYFVRYTLAHSYDIFYSSWQDTGWGAAINIGPPINTDWMEFSCCISPDGKKLYFDSFLYWETMYPHDLCVSEKTDTGWTYPQLIFQDYYNNSGWENAPSISQDGNILYFQRWGLSPWERDIWYTIFDGENWTSSINIGSPINSPEAEMTPSISSDGNTLYFSHMVVHGAEQPKTPKIYVSHRLVKVDEIKSDDEIVKNIFLENYPNPFNFHTVIRFKTKINNHFVTLKIYDIIGKEVITLINKQISDAKGQTVWNGKDSTGRGLPSGLYFCELMVDDRFTKTIKLLLLK